MLQLQPKNSTSSSQKPTTDFLVLRNNQLDDGRQHWTLTKGAFHQSFDERNQGSVEGLSSSCVDLNDTKRFSRKRRSAFSSGVGKNDAFSIDCCGTVGSGYASGSVMRAPTLGGRSPQSSFDSNDVGQISVNLMRVNGAIAPFKALLTSSVGTPGTPTAPATTATGKSASSLHLAHFASPRKLHTIGSNYALESIKRRDSITTKLSETPVVNIEG